MSKSETKMEHTSGLILQTVQQMRSGGVQAKDDPKWFWSFFEEKCREENIPRHGTFELTPMCNLNCKMCYVHLDQGNDREKNLITTERWIEIIDEARKAGMLEATLTGGECLTHPGFKRIYLNLYDHGIQTTILSNGLLMDEHRTEFLRRHPPRAIQITLYGSSEDAYEAVTGHRVYQQVKGNIERLRDAGLPVMISMTPNAYSIDEPEDMIQSAEEFGIRNEINFAILTPRKETGRAKAEASEKMMLALYRARKEYREIRITPPEPCDLPKPNRDCGEHSAKGLRCGAGRSGFAILHDGRMSACTGLGNAAAVPMKKGFQAAWKDLNEKMMRYPRPMECDQCAYRKVCLPCAAIHLDAPVGHCDIRICQRIQHMAAEGLL